MDKQQLYKQKKEERQKKKDKEQYSKQQKRAVQTVKNYTIAVLVVVIIVFGLYLFVKSATPQSEDFSRTVSVMEVTHIAEGSPLPEYNSNPPSLGPHYGQTARSGFRDEIISDQNIIHNLEHGDVWIAYQPNISSEIKKELKQFAGAKVIITPRETNDTDIALVAWGRVDTFDIVGGLLPKQRIKDFIKRYTNKGPERVTGASGGI